MCWLFLKMRVARLLRSLRKTLAVTSILEYSVLNMRPLDLHVLGTPPAFVLSQDQTLKLIFEKFN